jgi:O-antigen ligase
MLGLFPLALLRFWGERTTWLRLGAAACTGLILSGIVLTYSRGAFVASLVVLVMVLLMHSIRAYRVLSVLVLLVLLAMLFLPTQYVARLDTLRGIQGLFTDESAVSPDASLLGRATEMLAALRVFLDYPVLGVGPGQYEPFYSDKYHSNPDVAFKYVPGNRGAHNLYLQIAAETGLVGLTAFLAMVLLLLRQLWQASRQWAHSRPDVANLTTALFLSLTAYLMHSMFAHLAYERYFFLFLALAGAAVQICRSDLPATSLTPTLTLPHRGGGS